MDIKYIFIKTKEDNTDCMNKFFNSRIRNIGAEYVNTRHNIDSKYWIILPKRTTFISNRQTVLAEYKFKGRTFSF
jgi:peptidyl-tRNA hydrolase